MFVNRSELQKITYEGRMFIAHCILNDVRIDTKQVFVLSIVKIPF
jgi:hypothetical protein